MESWYVLSCFLPCPRDCLDLERRKALNERKEMEREREQLRQERIKILEEQVSWQSYSWGDLRFGIIYLSKSKVWKDLSEIPPFSLLVCRSDMMKRPKDCSSWRKLSWSVWSYWKRKQKWATWRWRSVFESLLFKFKWNTQYHGEESVFQHLFWIFGVYEVVQVAQFQPFSRRLHQSQSWSWTNRLIFWRSNPKRKWAGLCGVLKWVFEMKWDY